MNLKKIVLSVKRSKFRSDDPTTDEANAEFLNVRKSILERDQYTCQYCGFRSEKYQEVHHLDDNHENNDPANLITACPLCHACHHVGLTGVKGRGDVIYLDPSLEIKQADLNQLVRALWVAESGDSKDMQRIATERLSRLYKATVTSKRKIGTADATILGDFMLSLDEDSYTNRENFLSGVYILPRLEQYKQQIEFWRVNSFKATPPSVWSKISKQRIKKWIVNETGDASDEDISAFINKSH